MLGSDNKYAMHELVSFDNCERTILVFMKNFHSQLL